MPKPRSKPYMPGETASIYIPPAIDKRTLKYINSHKYLSPAIIDLLREKAKQVYPNFDEKEEVNNNE